MKKTLILLTGLFSSLFASAQYNYSNQWAIALSGGVTSYSGYGIGVTAHQTIGHSSHSINFGTSYFNNPINSLKEAKSQQIIGEIYYMFSCDNAIKSSWFHINLGIGAVVGYETIQNVSSELRLGHENGIRYGVVARFQPEFKITKGVGLFIEPKYMYLFNNAICEQTFTVSAGIKLYL